MSMRHFQCLWLVLASSSALAAPAATEHRAWTQSYPVDGAAPHLHVRNVWGSVQVHSGPPGEIRVTVDEVRSAPTAQLFARALVDLKLDVQADAHGVSMVVGDREERWQSFNHCPGCRVDYQFRIQAPPGAIVNVGTVMDGKVQVEGIAGTVSASNVNGPVSIDGLRNCAAINTVNGPIKMAFSQAPSADCSIETINGDITLNVPGDSGIDLSLDLFNGEVSSELPIGPFALPATVEQVVDEGRTRYRVQQLAGLRVGAGGPVYAIKSMNGDVRVKRNP